MDNVSPKKIAFFDFDGTITAKDTVLEVIKFQKGIVAFYFGLLINAPFLVASKINIITNQSSKERLLRYFFSGTTLSSFQTACNDFVLRRLPFIIRPKALVEICKLKDEGFEVVVVSASAEDWIQPWCDKLGIQLLANKLEVKDGFITGKISGKNCHGHEKVVRIKFAYDTSAYGEIYCYGDTNADKPMLALATKSFYKPFR